MPHRAAVTGTARSFVHAIQAHDGKSACQLLTDDSRSSIAGALDTPCAKAVLNVNENGASVGEVDEWGDAAQVHIGSDVLFLRMVSGAWKVSAAGCSAQPSGPYDCKVGG